jgi:hypothetical protein
MGVELGSHSQEHKEHALDKPAVEEEVPQVSVQEIINMIGC